MLLRVDPMRRRLLMLPKNHLERPLKMYDKRSIDYNLGQAKVHTFIKSRSNIRMGFLFERSVKVEKRKKSIHIRGA